MEKNSKLILASLIGLVGMGSMTYPMSTFAEKFPLEWQAPTQNCDGTTLPISELGSYKVYYSKDVGRSDSNSQSCGCSNPHQYDNVYEITDPTLTTFEVPVNEPGTYYVTMTAVNIEGNESCYSRQVVKEVNSATPDAPLNFEISLR